MKINNSLEDLLMLIQRHAVRDVSFSASRTNNEADLKSALTSTSECLSEHPEEQNSLACFK